jgi:hypothetical protein
MHLPLDVRGEVHGIPESQFTSPAELGKLLAASSVCQECVVKQLFRYAVGRHETDADREPLEVATQVFRQSGFQMSAVMAYLGELLASPEGTN